MFTLSRQQVRDFDHNAATLGHLPTRLLMENAGRGAAEVLLRLGIHGPVLVCCGKGNNGGDGLVLARYLAAWEVDVSVVIFAAEPDMTDDAGENSVALRAAGVPCRFGFPLDEASLEAEIGQAEWLVDALVGIGLTGPMRPPLDRVAAMMNAGPGRIFALDLPSGLDADTGEPLGATIRAKHTATFVAPKKGFANPAAATWTGRVHVVDLGTKPAS